MKRFFVAAVLSLAISTTALAQSMGGGGINNGSSAGGGGGGGSPGGTSGQIQFNNSGSFGGLTPAIATGCGATGGTIGNTLLGTIASAESSNQQTGAGYTVQSTDCGKIITLSNSSAETLTLNNLSANQFFEVLNIGAGTWTISAGTGSINGGPTSLAQGQGAHIVFDGTNWDVQAGAGSGSAPTQTITAGTNVTTSGTCSGTALNCTVNSSGGSGSPSLVSYYFSGQWYTFYTFDTTANNTANANTMYCYFGVVAKSVVIKALGAYVATGVSGNAQFAIYKQDSTTAGQFDLVDSTGSVSTASSGTAISATVNNTTDTLSPGTLYAQCANNSGGATFLAWTTLTGLTSITGTATINAGIQGYEEAETLGTWPSTFLFSSLTGIAAGRVPIVDFQVN